MVDTINEYNLLREPTQGTYGSPETPPLKENNLIFI
jgi:hypothetical protein